MQNDEEKDNSEKTIYEFCQDGDEKTVEKMLKNNFDVNKPDETVTYHSYLSHFSYLMFSN